MRHTIRRKISIGFFCLFLVLSITILMTLFEVKKVKEFSDELKNYQLSAYEAEGQFDFGIINTSFALQSWVLTRNPKYITKREVAWKALDEDIATFEGSESHWKSEKVRSEWAEIKPLILSLKEEQDKIIKIINSNEKNPAIQDSNQKKAFQMISTITEPLTEKIILLLDGPGTTLLNNAETPHDNLSDSLITLLVKNNNDLNKGLSILSAFEWILLIIGVVLASLITTLTSKSIVNPIQKAIAIATQIAKGDRRLKITVQGNDETADLLVALKTMSESIADGENKLKYSEEKVQKILSELQERIKLYCDHIALVSKGDLTKTLTVTSDDDLSNLGKYLNEMTASLSKISSQIVVATNEMSTGLSQLENSTISQAASASQQATSVTEVNNVVEEIKSISKQTLGKASNLGEFSEKTHATGEKGKESINDMVLSMQSLQAKMQMIADTILSLSDKTHQIGNITEAVSDIAKQSRLLALNAAIEAAKAGEAGKGFAVVASEVKVLAEKSQASTDSVRQLLQDIRQATERAVIVTEEGTKSVEANLGQARETGSIINALGDVIQQSSIASQQIVAAVNEESVGIDQMIKSIGEIDKVTQQFSSATEQTKQATINLTKVADNLKESVSIYKLTKDM